MPNDRPLREIRRLHKLTQRELAEKLGVTAGAVGNWEIGFRTPDLETAKRIATVLGVGVEEIRFGEPEPIHSSSHATNTA